MLLEYLLSVLGSILTMTTYFWLIISIILEGSESVNYDQKLSYWLWFSFCFEPLIYVLIYSWFHIVSIFHSYYHHIHHYHHIQQVQRNTAITIISITCGQSKCLFSVIFFFLSLQSILSVYILNLYFGKSLER